MHLVPVIAGFFDIRSYIVWVKANSGVGASFYAPTTEVVVFGTRGRPPRELSGKRLPNVFARALPPDAERIHMTQKPTELLAMLITKSTCKGELVVDPFAGSAATLVAAKETGRSYWGVEKDERYYLPALARLNTARFSDAALRDFGDDAADQATDGYRFIDVHGTEHVMPRSPTDPYAQFGHGEPIPVTFVPDWARFDDAGFPIYPAVCGDVTGEGIIDEDGNQSIAPELFEDGPRRVCPQCARWLATHGERDVLESAIALERSAWLKAMIAPTEFEPVVKPKGRNLRTGKSRRRNVA